MTVETNKGWKGDQLLLEREPERPENGRTPELYCKPGAEDARVSTGWRLLLREILAMTGEPRADVCRD